MAIHPSYPRTRIYIEPALSEQVPIILEDKQAHYLSHVLRLKEGDIIGFFNGKDGEWQAAIDTIQKKAVTLTVQKQLRPHKQLPELWLLCAPLKNSKTEWVIEKATELGVTRICPVITQFTVVDKINEARWYSIVTEAAEQCERVDVPIIAPIIALPKLLTEWPQNQNLIFGDESGGSKSAKELLPTITHTKKAVLIGPEGGFSPVELELLRSLPYVCGMCMGPRVMRADTAAIAALTLLQAWCGDWDDKPEFRK
jgi:16S rRNA (uracil1498-N3)-methyltransferase